MARIVIIGGGISGLSAAYDIHRDGHHQVTLLEASDRWGGKLVTHRQQGLLIEGGPDSVFTSKPWAVELMAELGLEAEFVEPIGSGFSILSGGKLHSVPRAMASLIPSANSALESIGFLSAAARRRIRSEGNVPKGTGGDETIASFFRRRFGNHFSKSLAEPLLAGIHAGDAEVLSMKALYPSYIGLEQKNGKLTFDAIPGAPVSGGAHSPRRAGFLTLKDGVQRLVDVLVARLDGADLRLNSRIDSLERVGDGHFQIGASATIDADAVIFSIPSYTVAKLLAGVAPDAAGQLASIRHASTAVVSLAYPIDAFPHGFHGNGFLVPADEPASITGCTFSSSKWPGRAPEGVGLLRAFMGRDRGLNVDEYSDEQLLQMAMETVTKQLGVQVEPVVCRVDRWTRAMPQYEVGHVELMERIEAALGDFPIFLAGGSFRGTGIPDCIKQGRHSARKVLDRFG
ncbi:MAG: protoporphyrinogen oxidase [Fimbriimonas sp.]|nr:protoporphyrinogen oxidase [Fimbriimonas sp.]